MKYFLSIAILFSFSCIQHKDTTSTKSTIIAKSSFTCNYSFNKIHCKQLYHDYKQLPDTANEIQLITFLKDSLLPCWYGTQWNFYGTTEEPGKGAIACGYFVTTVLRDAGLPIQRIKLAQCASEEMIKAVCRHSSIRRFINVPLYNFVERTKSMGFGLYIVGLDKHTGFILNDGSETYFIHSTYIRPGCVIKEKANESIILGNSRYRVVGKIKL